MSFWQEPIRFGSLQVPRFMAAPLDGITDSPMRQMIRTFSPHELLFTEMRHVACVVNSKEDHSLRWNNMEHPLAFQFSANKEQFIDEAVEKVLERKIEMINLNIGCPARNVIKSGSGSALMANPEQLKILLERFIKRINGRVPFTVKIRSGFKEKNAVEIAKLIEGCGADGIIIHPRLQTQLFAGLPDVAVVKEVKLAVTLPIVFSGNITSFARAQKMYNETGCDGFMIGRALQGAPWKIKEMTCAMNNEPFSITTEEALRCSFEHMKLSIEHYGPHGHHCFKKHLPVYIRSVPGAADLRKTLLSINDAHHLTDQMRSLINLQQ